MTDRNTKRHLVEHYLADHAGHGRLHRDHLKEYGYDQQAAGGAAAEQAGIMADDALPEADERVLAMARQTAASIRRRLRIRRLYIPAAIAASISIAVVVGQFVFAPSQQEPEINLLGTRAPATNPEPPLPDRARRLQGATESDTAGIIPFPTGESATRAATPCGPDAIGAHTATDQHIGTGPAGGRAADTSSCVPTSNASRSEVAPGPAIPAEKPPLLPMSAPLASPSGPPSHTPTSRTP